ncbi:MAG: isocitrate/isopropylmalate family dehydrogenase, partial [Verrucomicrobia bacterium]|nr:isocitrate/isopropylmalate family dehydrogenase [Verrucomicrobiota bacterium]
KGIANPIATILSVAMMLEWLDYPETVRASRLITQAVETILADPAHRTADLGSTTSTTQMGNLVCQALT